MSDELKSKVDGVLDRRQRMRRERANWDNLFQELKELVRPDTSDFQNGVTRAQDSRRRLYDGTAPWSAEQLAAGLHSYLSSPVDQWFSLGVVGVPPDQLSFDAKLWVEQVANIIYSHYQSSSSNFNPSMHESYLDLGVFGTSVLYQWLDDETHHLMFKAYPLAEVNGMENYKGVIDTVQRVCVYTVRQLIQEFGELPPKLSKMKSDEKVKIIHDVHPRSDRDPNLRTSYNKAFSSMYVCEDTQELVSESGYDWMPYHIPRWTKLAGDTYGRSPALSVIPAIRMVNAMKKTVIQAGQKMVDPPLQADDDGFLLPIRTAPGSINYARPGSSPITALPTAQRIDIGVDMISAEQDMIRSGFYVDWLVRPSKKERQTAQEVMDDRNQMLSMMGPIVGRLQSELLGPIVKLSYLLLNRRGLLPETPGDLDGAELEISYVSPAAKAQSMARGQGMQSYIQQIVQLQPLFPNLADSINEDNLNAELQDLTDVPRRVLNSPRQTQAKRESREQANQQAQMAQGAPMIAKAAKDFAQARQLAPDILT